MRPLPASISKVRCSSPLACAAALARLSSRRTVMPACAAIWAMPRPMAPVPTMAKVRAARSMSVIERVSTRRANSIATVRNCISHGLTAKLGGPYRLVNGIENRPMATVTASRPRAKPARFADRDVDPPLAASANKDRQFVIALARGLDVLRAFTPQDGLLGNHEIAARTGLPRPTISRLTHTLTRLGYLKHSERLGKYQLGTAVLSLGYAVLANIGLRQVARPLMQELADQVNASV